MHTASEKSFYEIEINQNGITFTNGERIVFRRASNKATTVKLVLQKGSICPASLFSVFTADRPTKILFNKKRHILKI